jgi:hypothetical protein
VLTAFGRADRLHEEAVFADSKSSLLGSQNRRFPRHKDVTAAPGFSASCDCGGWGKVRSHLQHCSKN